MVVDGLKKLLPILLLSTFSFITVAAASTLPRHIDPAELEEEGLFSSSFFTMYSGIMDFISSENWDSALSDLKSTAFTYVPADMQFVVSRFKGLLNDTAYNLEDIQMIINNVTRLFDEGRLGEINAMLGQALLNLAITNNTIGEVETTSIEIGDILKASPMKLLEGVTDIYQLTNTYTSMLIDLYDGYEGDANWTQTALTIYVNTTSALLGSSVRVYGNLSTFDGVSLPLKNIDVHFDGSKVGNVSTDSDGAYVFILPLPYIYKANAMLYTVYFPEGNDLEIYLPSASEIVTVDFLFYTPDLTATAQSVAYPGLNMTIQGNLTLNSEKLSGYNIAVEGLDTHISRETTVDGSFNLDLKVPDAFKTGNIALLITSSPQLLIGPASTTVDVTIVRHSMFIDLTLPQYLILAGTDLTLQGTVSSEDIPVSNSVVKASVGEWSSQVTTIEDGYFYASIHIPLTASTAEYECSVSVFPSQPWINSSSKMVKIFVINIIYLLAPLSVVCFAGVMFWRFLKPSDPPEDLSLLQVKSSVLQMSETASVNETGLTGVYLKIVRTISKYTGVLMKPSDTIREYLHFVKKKMGKLYGFFESLSIIIEKYLYAPKITQAEEEKAEHYAEEIDKELQD